MGQKATVYGCDVPGHPNHHAHEHDTDHEGVEFLAQVTGVTTGVIQAALNVGGYVIVKRPIGPDEPPATDPPAEAVR